MESYRQKRSRVYAAIIAEAARDRERAVQAAERILLQNNATQAIIRANS